ncbi:hypothetical protein NFI96_029249, partial [Prochilodus magdalenae]
MSVWFMPDKREGVARTRGVSPYSDHSDLQVLILRRLMQMISELKDQNNLLKNEKDDLNRLIQEQGQQWTEKMQRALKEETTQLECDLNEERSRYQNLLSEHLRLEEKYDDLKEEISLTVNVPKPGHRRTDSTHSSNESEYTYNSEFAESEDGSRGVEDVTKASLDMALFLKLQKRVTELEQEKQGLQNELDRREEQFQRARARDDEEHKKARSAELEYESLKFMKHRPRYIGPATSALLHRPRYIGPATSALLHRPRYIGPATSAPLHRPRYIGPATSAPLHRPCYIGPATSAPLHRPRYIGPACEEEPVKSHKAVDDTNRQSVGACSTYRVSILWKHKNRVRPNSILMSMVLDQRQELESENKKLKHNLNEMRQSLMGNAGAVTAAPGSPAYKVLLDQLNASNEELEVRKEEVLILRSQLVSQKEAMQHKETMTEPLHYVEDVQKLTDAKEISQAYMGLKDTNRSPRFLRRPLEVNELVNRLRLLETQLQSQRRSYDSELEVLRGELQSVKEENNRQQQLLAQNLQLPPEARIEASLQHEITRLTNENLVNPTEDPKAYRIGILRRMIDLMEQLEKQDKTVRKLKKQLKVFAKKINDLEGGQVENVSPGQMADEPLRPVNIPRREKDFQGMLEYKKEDELKLVKNLILELKPRGVAVNLIPGLPAYILFMCLRHADYVNDDQKSSRKATPHSPPSHSTQGSIYK